MIVMKNQHDELVPMRIQNSWRVCINYKKLNQATRKDHFPLPFIDQVLEKLSGNPTTVFWMVSRGTCKFILHLKINTRLPSPAHLALLHTLACHLAYVMLQVRSNVDCMEVFMDDFTVYADSFEACLSNLSEVLNRCIDTNLVLNFKK
ncbi:hypothetical protein CR513_34191, partial [Mucuna pruriens]